MTNEYYGAHTDLVPGTKARSGDINAMDQAIVEAFDKVPSAKAIKIGALNYATNTSITPDHYAVTMDAVVTSYTPGLEVKLNPVLANTGPATLNINGIGNVAIKRQDGANVQAGDILAAPVALTYSPSMNAFVIPPTGNAHVVAAANSATAAAASASSAGSSASTASTAASTATTKAGEAGTSASTASTAAGTATTKAGEASGSASAAAGSASAAATSASAAATSALNLATAVSTATGAASTATTKAGEAAGSASAAATSATNLSQAVSAAQAAQSLAQQHASGTGVIANGKYSAEYYAGVAASYANAVATGQMNADWNATDPSSKAYILNKPAINVAANFPAGNTHSVSSEPNTLRAITNPATGLGYAGGVRFRLGSINEDNASPWADVMDLSTHVDSSAGGVNGLYFYKGVQRIVHKWAAAGATAWTAQTLAYLSDLSAYATKDSAVLTGPVTLGGRTGLQPVIKDNVGTDYGNDLYLPFDGGSTTQKAFRFRSSYNGGTGKFSIGRSTNSGAQSTDPAALTYAEDFVILGNGRTLLGATAEDGSGARLQVAGGISSPGGFIGKATSATTADNAANAANANTLAGLPVLGAGTGGPWNGIPRVNSDGVMEIGSIIDFHNTSADGVDYAVRLRTGNTATDLFINNGKILTDAINRTNYKGVTDSFVAGQLMWKANGNNSTVFDASAGTAPDGSAVNNKDPYSAWSSALPTLMGWNGSNTCGVRVDSARVADGIATGAMLTNMVLVKPTFKGYIEQLQALNPGATVTLNPDNGTLIELTTTVTSTTITLPAAVAGASYTLLVKYGSTGHTLTFTGGGLRWTNGNTIPTATSVANKIDAYVFTCGTGYTVGRDGWRNA